MYPDRGASVLMWGSDYPHFEGTHPFTRQALRNTFAGIDPAHVEAMVGLNAARAYGFDLERLRPLADRIGPTVDELSRKPDSTPDDCCGRAFREASGWPADAIALPNPPAGARPFVPRERVTASEN